MKPHLRLAETHTADGKALVLFSHDGEFSLNFDGHELMSSAYSVSEQLLGELGVAHLRAKSSTPVRILIGGLGLGATLRSVLDGAPAGARIDVAELLAPVVAWNRTHLAPLHADALADPRVKVSVTDVATVIRRAAPATYDAILLDVDNGPAALVAADNARLYADAGLRALHAALRPGGRAIIWSAAPDRRFEARLKRHDFQLESVPAKTHPRAKRPAYTLYIATRPT